MLFQVAFTSLIKSVQKTFTPISPFVLNAGGDIEHWRLMCLKTEIQLVFNSRSHLLILLLIKLYNFITIQSEQLSSREVQFDYDKIYVPLALSAGSTVK